LKLLEHSRSSAKGEREDRYLGRKLNPEQPFVSYVMHGSFSASDV
jgi:hypothetical protein